MPIPNIVKSLHYLLCNDWPPEDAHSPFSILPPVTAEIPKYTDPCNSLHRVQSHAWPPLPQEQSYSPDLPEESSPEYREHPCDSLQSSNVLPFRGVMQFPLEKDDATSSEALP